MAHSDSGRSRIMRMGSSRTYVFLPSLFLPHSPSFSCLFPFPSLISLTAYSRPMMKQTSYGVPVDIAARNTMQTTQTIKRLLKYAAILRSAGVVHCMWSDIRMPIRRLWSCSHCAAIMHRLESRVRLVCTLFQRTLYLTVAYCFANRCVEIITISYVRRLPLCIWAGLIADFVVYFCL